MKDVPWIRKTWFEIDRSAERFASKLQPLVESGKICQLHAIPRGGLPMGVMLSHLLGIPMVYREDQITGDTLVFDEIVHRGTTMMMLLTEVSKRSQKPTTAAYLLRRGSFYTVDYFDEIINDWGIVLFPWETEESAWASYMRSQAG